MPAVPLAAALTLARWAELLPHTSVAELELRLERDKPHPKRCVRATRRVIRPTDCSGYCVHVTDDEARALGWRVAEVQRPWSARDAACEHAIDEQSDAQEKPAEPDEPPKPQRRGVSPKGVHLAAGTRAKLKAARTRAEAQPRTHSPETKQKIAASGRASWERRRAAGGAP
jgi:hypothetical protein